MWQQKIPAALRREFDVLRRIESIDNQSIATEIGWSKELVTRIDNSLALALLAAKRSGLEGVPIPLVLSFPSSKLLSSPITPTHPDWLKYLTELRAEQAVALAQTSKELGAAGAPIGARLVLVPSLSSSMDSAAVLQSVSKATEDEVFASLNSPGELELDRALLAVEINEIGTPGATGKGQTVAIIDGEVQFAPGLEGRIARPSNFSDSEWDDPGIANSLARTHGTQVASIVAGSGIDKDGNQTAKRGIAPGATVSNYKIAPLSDDGLRVAAAIEQACFDGVRVANLSWGQSRAVNDGKSIWARTVDAVFAKGMLVVKSAGNSGPASRTITSPADAVNVLSVGATDPTGASLQNKSSCGPTVDGRAKPELVAPGGGMVVPGVGGQPSTIPVPGTSFAAPVVSGICALILEKHPALTSSELRTRVLQSCALMPHTAIERQGSGLVNAYRALEG